MKFPFAIFLIANYKWKNSNKEKWKLPLKDYRLMTIQKTCPQCGTFFEGRSNQFYCTPLCKQRAFHANKAGDNSISQTVPKESPSLHLVDKYIPDPRMEKVYESLRLESAERMKRLELEEREQEREHELERERQQFERERERMKWEQETLKLKADQLQRDARQEPVSKKAIDNDSDKDEESSGFGKGAMVLLGIGGLLLSALVKKNVAKSVSPAVPDSSLDFLKNIKPPTFKPKNGSKTDT